jgi:beta-N-acetylhexosaminidase
LLPPLPEVRARLRTPENVALAKSAAQQSITLVKDVQRTLPISVAQHRRVVLVTDPERVMFVSHHGASPEIFGELLTARGFEVRPYSADAPPTPADTDLIVYVLAQESVLSVGNIFLNWRHLHGGPIAAMQRFWTHTPCILISLGHPYYLYDAPRMPCVINTYCSIESVQRSLVNKLLGEEPFEGKSPVDALCGLPDAAY